MTAPAKRTLWQGRVEEEAASGRRGPGTTSFCVDGRSTIYEEIVDWRPFNYFTETRTLPGGKVVVTTELIAAEGCTRVRVRGKPVEAKFAHRVTAPLRARRLRRAYERLGALLEEGGDAR